MDAAVAGDPLTTIMARIREPWMLDFLLGTTVESDLAILASPTQTAHAMAVEVECKKSDPSSRDGHGPLGYEMKCTWAMVPCFSVGRHTALVVAQYDKTTSNPVMEPPTSPNTFMRHIRDDLTGDILISIDEADQGEQSLVLFAHGTSTSRSRLELRGHRDPMRTALRAADAKRVRHALISAGAVKEARHCPACLAPPYGSCGCAALLFPMRRAAHPLDFVSTRANSAIHAGNFNGKYRLVMYAAGIPCKLVDLDSRIVTNATKPGAYVQSLCDRAARERAQQLCFSSPGVDAALGTRTDKVFPGIHSVSCSAEHEGAKQMCCASPAADNALDTGFAVAEPVIDSVAFSSTSGLLDWITETLSDDMDAASAIGNPAIKGVDANSGSTTVSHELLSEAIPKAKAIAAATKAALETPRIEKVVDKALLRKIKNREAAARSNLRRKQSREALKQKLEDERQKLQRLRPIEMKLRQENLLLKKLVKNS